MNIEIKRPKFYPLGHLDNKSNLKRISRVFPDGSIIERVYLDVPNIRHREHLICIHYLRHITRHFLQDYIGVEIISRDDPWDFKIKLSNGLVFNIEITSIADNSKHFENNKKEERYAKWATEENIPLHQLIKLVIFFPDKEVSQIILDHKSNGILEDEMVANPYYPPKNTLFISTLYDSNKKLTDLLINVIDKKINKKHTDKENTILIIDNRTGAYDMDEYYEALENIHPLVHEWPFPEVWLYTGYYSDDTGNDAEFSFAPLKTTPDQSEILEKMMNSDKVDESGRYIWP